MPHHSRLSARGRVLFAIVLAVTVFPAANGCPLTTDPGSSDGSTSGPALDIGGTSGAIWEVSYDEETQVTLRATGQVATKKVKRSDGPLSLLGSVFALSTFCWRTDVICPDEVLAPQTALVQPEDGQLVVGYRRKGPLATLSQQGLWGTLDGSSLAIPLGMAPSKADPCTLATGSAIYGTASPSTTDATRSDSMQGQTTLRYSGSCVTLGGSGALQSSDLLELSVLFSAKRR